MENPFGGSGAVPRQGCGAPYPLWSQSRPRALREEARHNSNKAEQKIRFLTSYSRERRRPSMVCFSPPLSSTFSPSLSAYLQLLSRVTSRHRHLRRNAIITISSAAYIGKSLIYHVWVGCHPFPAIQTLARKFIGNGLHLVVRAPFKCHAEPRFASRLTSLVKLRRPLRLFLLQFSYYTQEGVRRRSSSSLQNRRSTSWQRSENSAKIPLLRPCSCSHVSRTPNISFHDCFLLTPASILHQQPAISSAAKPARIPSQHQVSQHLYSYSSTVASGRPV